MDPTVVASEAKGEKMTMSRYDVQQLISMWARERLTLEQAMGQILLHIDDLSRRVSEVEKRTNPDRRSNRGIEEKK